MKCPACKALMPEDALFCSSCGTELNSQPSQTEGRNLEVALAAANLLRVRGAFEEAERRCIEVLRADPNNVHAHSLLGDIYMDQGRLDDARQWYQLALDLNPHSRPDREKLNRANRLRAAQGGPTDEEEDREARARSSIVVRWLAVILAMCVLGAVAAILVNRTRARRLHGTTVARASQPVAATAASPLTDGRKTRAGLLPGEIMTDQTEAAEDEGVGGDETLLDREVHLEQLLVETRPWTLPTMQHAVVLTGTGRTAMLFAYGDFGGAPPTQDQIVRDTLHAVQQILQGDADVQAVEVVIRAAGSGVPYHTLVRARATRSAVAANTTPGTAAEARRVFSLWRWTPAWANAAPTPSPMQ